MRVFLAVSATGANTARLGHVTKAIAESCNTFYYDLSHKLGIDEISSFMRRMGFGERTGIDIAEESPALMPDRGWKRARFNEPWYQGETLSVGIGQSFLDRHAFAISDVD